MSDLMTLFMCDTCGTLSKDEPSPVEIEVAMPTKSKNRQTRRFIRAICKTCYSIVNQKPLEFKPTRRVGFRDMTGADSE